MQERKCNLQYGRNTSFFCWFMQNRKISSELYNQKDLGKPGLFAYSGVIRV